MSYRLGLLGPLLLVGTSPCWAQNFIDDLAGGPGLRVEYGNRSYFNEGLIAQDGSLHFVQHDFRLSLPVHETEQTKWRVGGRLRVLDLDTNAVLLEKFGPLRVRGDALPNELYDMRLETTYSRELNNGWTAGVNAQLGSASDEPFASADEWLVSATGFMRIPVRERDAWMIFLNFDNNRQFAQNIPIPGFAYDWRPSEDLQVLAGVPVAAVEWRPLERLEFEAFYFLPRIFHAGVGYEVVDDVELYGAFDWDNQRFLRAGRDDSDDRLFYFEKRVMTGVRWTPLEQVEVDFGGGWAFDRFFFEGQDYDDRGDSRIDISDGPMLMLQVRVML